MCMGVRVKQRTMKKRKSESCIACTHWKMSSHITHSCFCRDDGNKDAIMAELCDSLESEDEEDGEEISSTNGLGDAIAKAWSLRTKKLHRDYSITA